MDRHVGCSPAFEGAYNKGWRAYGDGIKDSDCPYRKPGGSGFRQAFINAWERGWTDREEGRVNLVEKRKERYANA